MASLTQKRQRRRNEYSPQVSRAVDIDKLPAPAAPVAPGASNAKALLRIRNARRTFRMGEVDVLALRDATLDVEAGEFLAIVGPSGSGKSTLLNLIGGMDRPTEGEVWFEDLKISSLNDRQLTLYRRHQVGFIFQFYNLVPTLTALENIQVVTEIVKDPMDPAKALDMVGLASRGGHFPAQMSGGEQQRVAIARAIAGNPRVLLCDEPTGALDSVTSKEVVRLIVRLHREFHKTVILITHNPVLALTADRVATIRDGRIVSIVKNDPPRDVEELDL